MKWPDQKSLPMVMAGVDVSASRLLDLRSPEVAVEIARILNSERQEGRTHLGATVSGVTGRRPGHQGGWLARFACRVAAGLTRYQSRAVP